MKMKCVVGATLLTPVMLAVAAGLVYGIVFLLEYSVIIFTVFQYGLLLVIIAAIWYVLYTHCRAFNMKDEATDWPIE